MRKPIYKTRQTYLLRLPPGEDLLVGLYRICREYNVEYVAEVLIQELQGRPLVRERDPETGLWLWPVI